MKSWKGWALSWPKDHMNGNQMYLPKNEPRIYMYKGHAEYWAERVGILGKDGKTRTEVHRVEIRVIRKKRNKKAA